MSLAKVTFSGKNSLSLAKNKLSKNGTCATSEKVKVLRVLCSTTWIKVENLMCKLTNFISSYVCNSKLGFVLLNST